MGKRKTLRQATSVDRSFAKPIQNFSENLTALREFVKVVGALLDEKSSAVFKEHHTDLVPLLLAANSMKIPQLKLTKSAEERMKKEFGADIKITRRGNKCSVEIPDDAGARLAKAVERWSMTTAHRFLLYRSALISLISAAEWFFSQLLRIYIERYPDSAGIKDKTLTLEDLKSFSSVESAKEYLIDLRIDDVLRGSFEDWLKFAKTTLKLSMGYVDRPKNELIEIFQRRNVMVHNNGIVHSFYMQKVPEALRKDVKVGGRLAVTPKYLASAIDLIELNFLLIAAELWKQLHAKDEERSDVLNDIALRALTEERWPVAEGLCYFSMNDKQLSERSLLVAQMNYWQSVKWQGRFGEIRAAVQASDFSAKDDVYQIVRLALLDEVKKFFEMLPAVLANKKLTLEHLETWPIFRAMRNASAYQSFLEKHAHRFREASEAKKSEHGPTPEPPPTIQ